MPNIDETPQTVNPDAYKNLYIPSTYVPQPNKTDVELQPPIVIIPLVDTKIYEETPTALTCKIIGKPIPKVPYDHANRVSNSDLILI